MVTAFVVKVSRFDPSVDRAVYLETFRIPLPAESKWTAMDVLDYIHFHLDSSLSYCRHSALQPWYMRALCSTNQWKNATSVRIYCACAGRDVAGTRTGKDCCQRPGGN